MANPAGGTATGEKPDLDAIAQIRARSTPAGSKAAVWRVHARTSPAWSFRTCASPGADLRRAQFANANLFRAELRRRRSLRGQLHWREPETRRSCRRDAAARGVGQDRPVGRRPRRRARMEHASLVEASLQRAWLGRAHLEHATLVRADLHGAWVGRASLEQANLQGAMLVGAEFPRHQLLRRDTAERLFRRRGPAGCRSLRRRPRPRCAISPRRSLRQRLSTSARSCRRSWSPATVRRGLPVKARVRVNDRDAAPERRRYRTKLREDFVRKLRVAVDIGGTFTDICILDEGSGALRVAKTASTPEDPLIGAMRGARRGEHRPQGRNPVLPTAPRSPPTRSSPAGCRPPR